ncbi:MAG: hypothetical protein QM704_12395 [Anaeromyxobacteraceae bacterium]
MAYGIEKSRTDSWRGKKWRRRLREDPRTTGVAAVADRTSTQRLLSLLGELRNTVHGPTLDPVVSNDRRRTYVRVPPIRVPPLEQELQAWPEVPLAWWGIEFERRSAPLNLEHGDGFVTATFSSGPNDPVWAINVDPGVCLERVLVFATQVIDELGAAIDWTRFGAPAVREPLEEDDFLNERLRLLGGVWL